MSRAEHITMDFIKPTFNDLTLNFPPEPVLPEYIRVHLYNLDAMHEAMASGVTRSKAAARKARRGRRRLDSLVRGGWIIEFEPRQHLGLQTSTRSQRRRKKLGRA